MNFVVAQYGGSFQVFVIGTTDTAITESLADGPSIETLTIDSGSQYNFTMPSITGFDWN
jgi:hypothetical protein